MTMSTPHDPYNTPGNDDRDELPDFPGAGGEVPKPAGKPEPPSSIVNAVRLMFVGAALSVIIIIFSVGSTDEVREQLAEGDSGLTGDELDAGVAIWVGLWVVFGLISVGLWIWMALANKRGLSWARIVATVLGGLNILIMLLGLTQASGISAVSLIMIALAGLIIWLLFRPESSQYYNAVTDYRQQLRR